MFAPTQIAKTLGYDENLSDESNFLGESHMGSSPVAFLAFVFPVELSPLMISISFYICNCLYSPRWAERLKDFPKNSRKKIVF